MSPRYAPDDIDEVRERASIVEVVGEHVRLKRAGRSYVGLCPFHQEKTPSFNVDPEKSLFYCLGGETGVMTADGVKAIGDLAGTSQRILTTGGAWTEAPFRSFGDQALMRLTLGRNGIEKVLYATAEHRWFVRQPRKKGRGREVVTADLIPGHTLTSSFPRAPSASSTRPVIPSPFGIARGITYGDGARFNRGSAAELYGPKDEQLLRWFPLSRVYRHGSRATVTGLPAYFKDLPPLDESPSYLYGWLAGYFAADGHVAEDGYAALYSVDRKSLEHVRDVCTRVGVGTYGVREYRRRATFTDGVGRTSSYEGPILHLTLMTQDLTSAFFLIDEHRRRFEGHAKQFERRHWVVREVEPTDRVDEVFCATVPKKHAFVLEDNILTGNCHGCQTGGSIFTFLEQVEGLSFPEAVETLAQKYGVELREVGGGQRKQPSKRARMFALHEAAVDKYQELLAAPDAKPVRDYLDSRGIDDDQVAEFKIGFGGWRRDVLLASLRRRGFRGEELSSAGLATKDARGIKDMFYGRLVFPIFDPSGRPVGFGGRVLPDEHRAHGVPDAPKYLNSRETPIFKKSKTLYGTNWARAAVVKSKRLVLVEGYTDVIALHAAGVSEAVATCGTSLTEDHMKEISSRFGDVRVVMCLDADSAGQAAMSRERTEELADTYSPGEVTGGGWLPVGRGWLPEVHVANLPEGKDPADFVRAEGAEGLQRVVEGAVPLAEFLLRRALAGADTTSPDGRTRAVRGAISVLRQVGDTLLRHEYALWVADRVGVDSYEVMRALDTAAEQPRRRAAGPAPQAPVKLTGHHHVEREALRALFAFGGLMDDERLAPSEDDFTLPVHRSLFRLGAADHEQHGEIDTGRLGARVQEDELRSIVSEFAVDEPTSFEVARDTVTRLKVFSLERSIVERKERLRALDPDRDAEAYDTLFEELLELEKDKRILAAGD